MTKISVAFALVLASSSLVVGLASTDANAGARKICKQGLEFTRWRASTVI